MLRRISAKIACLHGGNPAGKTGRVPRNEVCFLWHFLFISLTIRNIRQATVLKGDLRERFLSGGEVRMKRWMKVVIGLAVSLVLFAVAGFFAVPPIAKSIMVKKLSEELRRDVMIDTITFNPFRFCLTVKGLAVRERSGGETFFSFQELFLNLEGMSLFRRAVIVDEVKLTSPYVHLVRNQDGSYNFSDLLAGKGKKEPEKKNERPFFFSLNNIAVLNGKIVFLDGPRSTRHLAEKIQIGLPFVSNMSYDTDTFVKPSLSAVINGTPYELKGRTKPFKASRRTEFDIQFIDLDVPFYLAYIPKKLNFRLVSANLDVDAKLVFRQINGGKQFLMLSGNTALKEIAVDDLAEKPLLRLPSIRAAMAGVMPLTGEIHLSKLVVDSPELHVRRDARGRLNLLSLFPEEEEKTEEPGGYKAVVDMDSLLVGKGTVHYEDMKPAETVKLMLSEIQFTGLNLSTAPGREGSAALTLALPKKGSVDLAGPVVLSPFRAKLETDVRGLDIPLFQPYIGEVLNVRVTGGRGGTRGSLILDTADRKLKAGYTGSLFLTRFAAIDSVQADDLLKWRTLYLNGVDIGYDPRRVHIREVALADFYSRIIVNRDGTLNLQNLAREEEEGGDAGGPKAAKGRDKTAEPEPRKKGAGDIRIGAVTLQGGEIDFLDTSITPHFSARLLEMGGRVSNLSSAEKAKGDVVLRGRLDGYAPLEITGKINPLKKDLYVDLKAVFKDMELSPVTPYSGRYAGYEIQKGKLSFDLKYLIDHRKLDSTNVVFVDQLTLGNKVDSPDATKLPVALAVSLLKDRHGQIKLDIPVSGSLDDPRFSVWRIVVQVVVNLLSKAATAPFALLGSLFGGGEELGYVEFDYGQAALGEENLKKIGILTKALSDRPALKIDLEGFVDAERDREAMKKTAFDHKLKVQKLNDVARGDKRAVKLGEIVIGDAEYEKYLREAYNAEKFPKPRNIIGLAKKLSVPEMEKLIDTHLDIKDDDLRLLAGQRAMNARDAILASGEVTADRVFIVESKYMTPPVNEKLRKSRVDFHLR